MDMRAEQSDEPYDPDYAPSSVVYIQSEATNMLLVAIVLNSALWCIGIFGAGIVWNHPIASMLAILTVGTCYVAPVMQVQFPHRRDVAAVFAYLSILFGVLAFGYLFVRS